MSKRRVRVDVVHLINGAVRNARFDADRAVMQMRGGEGYVHLVNGRDAVGPVDDVFFAHAEVMVRRPMRRKK